MPDGKGGAIGAGNRTIAPKARGRKPAVAWPYMRVRAANGAEPLERGRYRPPTSAELAAWFTAQAVPRVNDAAWLFPSGMAAMRGAIGAEVLTYQSAAEPIETALALDRVKRIPARHRITVDAFGARVERFTKSERSIAAFAEDPRITLCNGGAWVPCGPVVDGRPMVAKTIAKGVRAYVALDSHAAYFGPELSPGTARAAPASIAREAAPEYNSAREAYLATETAAETAAETAETARAEYHRAWCLDAAWTAHAGGPSLHVFALAIEARIAAIVANALESRRMELRRFAARKAAIVAEAPAMPAPRASERAEGIARTYHTPIGAGRVVEPAAPTPAELRANPRLPAMAPAELRAALSPETVEGALRVDAARALNRQRALCSIAQKRAAAIAARKAAK